MLGSMACSRAEKREGGRVGGGGPAAGVDAALAAGVADLGFGSTVVVAAARLSGIS